jgi:hypothetical protein
MHSFFFFLSISFHLCHSLISRQFRIAPQRGVLAPPTPLARIASRCAPPPNGPTMRGRGGIQATALAGQVPVRPGREGTKGTTWAGYMFPQSKGGACRGRLRSRFCDSNYLRKKNPPTNRHRLKLVSKGAVVSVETTASLETHNPIESSGTAEQQPAQIPVRTLCISIESHWNQWKSMELLVFREAQC